MKKLILIRTTARLVHDKDFEAATTRITIKGREDLSSRILKKGLIHTGPVSKPGKAREAP